MAIRTAHQHQIPFPQMLNLTVYAMRTPTPIDPKYLRVIMTVISQQPISCPIDRGNVKIVPLNLSIREL